MERIAQLYKDLTGREPQRITPLAGAGSNRQYFRVEGAGESRIAVIGTNQEENEAFIDLSKRFKQGNLPVPAVLAVSDDHMVYLQEDCGDLSLSAFMAQHRQEDGTLDEIALDALKATIRELPRFQFLPIVSQTASEFFTHCFPQQEMDRTSVMFDLNYFKYCYLKLTGVECHEIRLEEDFRRLCADLLAVKEVGFMYRDFQARNVMLKEGRPFYIDFQGGRRGPIYYDVASFLWQASAKYSDELRQKLIDQYITSARCYMEIDKKDFMQKLHLFVLFRTLQVLGAYGFRGLWEKKQHFIDSIPQALQNLSHCIVHGSCDAYPYLKEISLLLIDENTKTQKLKNSKTQLISALLASDTTYCKKSDTPLVVDVYSFSYKKGIPEDASGNGGGYVFDCRSTHNPGRYEQYKQITGLDQPVIDFLEEDGEILTFLESVYRLVDFHVQRFIDRGFSHLMLSFGCTGGQHRSVYSAQHVAEHIHHKFGIEVHIHHREQNLNFVLK